MQLNGSQIFVEVLCEQGVDTIFGYPGGAVLNLYDELYKNSDRITHVLTAHEKPKPQRPPAPPVDDDRLLIIALIIILSADGADMLTIFALMQRKSIPLIMQV